MACQRAPTSLGAVLQIRGYSLHVGDERKAHRQECLCHRYSLHVGDERKAHRQECLCHRYSLHVGDERKAHRQECLCHGYFLHVGGEMRTGSARYTCFIFHNPLFFINIS